MEARLGHAHKQACLAIAYIGTMLVKRRFVREWAEHAAAQLEEAAKTMRQLIEDPRGER